MYYVKIKSWYFSENGWIRKIIINTNQGNWSSEWQMACYVSYADPMCKVYMDVGVKSKKTRKKTERVKLGKEGALGGGGMVE